MCIICQALADQAVAAGETPQSVMIPANSPVDTLDTGASRGDADNIVTVHFVRNGQKADVASQIFDPSGADEVVSDGWSQYEIDRAMAALTTISNYINLTFVESLSPDADFQMVLDDDELPSPGLLGYFYLPRFEGDPSDSMGVFNKDGYGWSTNGLLEGGVGFSTIIHEALHGLGLAHPHDGANILPGLIPGGDPFGALGQFGLNQEVYTIMSYNQGLAGRPRGETFGSAATPMALDIAILQDLYGANETFENGDSTYELPDSNDAWRAIWDTGGIDEITYDGSRDVVIDLREATLRQEPGGGGFISAADGVGGGFTIANGAVIENAISGSGDDTLIGNDADNSLTANGGNDTISSGAGDDTINAGTGNDDAFGGSGDDSIDLGSGNDTASGNSGSDEIGTASGTNTIYGGSGSDIIIGGTGRDTVFGGSGADDITGNGGNDVLFGGRGNDTINGGSGDDQIIGGFGADSLTGGSDADTFIFEFVSDSYAGSGNRDTIQDFETGTDSIDLSAIGGLNFAGDITLDTSSGVNTVVGIDVNGDNVDDMEIFVAGVTGLTAGDFIL